MSEAKHTKGSIAALAEAARMMPWEKSVVDVPFNARYAFQHAITADHYMDLLEALQTLLDSVEGKRVTVGDCNQARAAIAKALGEPSHG